MIVKTQKEFEDAVKAGETLIEIRSKAGVWVDVMASGSATVRAYDSATVRAYGSATVMASGSATVRAYDSATVMAYDSATVRAYDSATVRAYDSATVMASGSATVTAYDSATVRAYDSATVRAYDSATVRAYDSATVTAYDSATVRAYDSATVRAYDSATVTASAKVAVHLHAADVTATGGVIIDVSKPIIDPDDWCDYHGVTVSKAGVATVYKAVDDTYQSGHGFDYTPGTKPTAPDWRDNHECGNGLHFSPSPAQALAYHSAPTVRFLAVGVKVDDIRPIPGDTAKCKAPRVVRACVEVDIDGTPIKGATA